MINGLANLAATSVARLRDKKIRNKAIVAAVAGTLSFVSLSAIGQYLLGSSACVAGKWFDLIPDWVPNWACGLLEMFR